jgi:hypothetical protein
MIEMQQHLHYDGHKMATIQYGFKDTEYHIL